MKHNIAAFLFGKPVEDNLPDRVRAEILRQQHNSEKLIGWVQMFLVCLWSTLYAISPAAPMSGTIHPVPWALGLYFIFTFGRLLQSYRATLSGRFLTISVVADITLLMVLIWSFHIQYHQPASFYLKTPTMIYVFIFISLRALRFDPRYILLAGGTAVAGWLILVLYVLWDEGGTAMITRNYVTYLTSNSLLVGAEIDKMVSIVLVSVVLAIAVMRAKHSFVRAVNEEIALSDLSRFVSPEIASRILQARQQIHPGDGESLNATVLFTDIEGFSTIAERLQPGELARMLNDYFAATSAVIHRFGGVITQFQGDAMLITFNAVNPDPAHACNAVQTALAIQDICANTYFGNGEKLRTRCGINTGTIVVGAIGTDQRLAFTVHGDNVNIASRLEHLNKQFGTYILASDATRTACHNANSLFDWQPRGDVTVRGRETATPIFSLAVPPAR